MTTRRYEITLLVLKYFLAPEEKFRTSKRLCNILVIIQTPTKH